MLITFKCVGVVWIFGWKLWVWNPPESKATTNPPSLRSGFVCSSTAAEKQTGDHFKTWTTWQNVSNTCIFYMWLKINNITLHKNHHLKDVFSWVLSQDVVKFIQYKGNVSPLWSWMEDNSPNIWRPHSMQARNIILFLSRAGGRGDREERRKCSCLSLICVLK